MEKSGRGSGRGGVAKPTLIRNPLGSGEERVVMEWEAGVGGAIRYGGVQRQASAGAHDGVKGN